MAADKSSRFPLHPAWRSPPAVAIFLAVAAAGLAADLLTKHLAFRAILDDPAAQRQMEELAARAQPRTAEVVLRWLDTQRRVLPGVQLKLSTNPGVVFGLGMPRAIVNVATVLAIGLVCAMFGTSDRRAWALHLAMGLILAGATGNLYDRLFSEVHLGVAGLEPIRCQVRDFINVDLGFFHYPWVFNVADAFLVIGVGILMLQWAVQGLRGARPAGEKASR